MRSEAGQSLIEVIVAITVGILVVTALTFATIFSLRNANFAKNSVQATKLAQEGIEWVRTGRDRNECINNLDSSVKSWNGNSSDINCIGTGPIWNYTIKGNSGNCENTTVVGSKCYFKVNYLGALTNIDFAAIAFPTSSAEQIPGSIFRRVVTLSDDAGTYTTQKTATVVVQWSDFAGPHESKLTTILRKL